MKGRKFDGLYHNYILDKKDYKVLESLYEQLKKLGVKEDPEYGT